MSGTEPAGGRKLMRSKLICIANPRRFQELEAAGTFEGKVWSRAENRRNG